MIQSYVDKLIENLPDSLKNSANPIHLDIILDGGVFNGSYLIGALFYLKEMEKRNFIQVERMSGASIGSICAFLYLIDKLDMANELYEIVCKDFKKRHNLEKLKDLQTILDKHIPDDFLEKINGKLYISYYHVQKGRKHTKSVYKCKKQVIDMLIRSSFLPFVIDGNLLYKNKFLDGINPYLLPLENNNNNYNNKKQLFLELFGYDKIGYLMNVKNEKTNFHRILSGLVDIHLFFIKQTSTQMCSYVQHWTYTQRGYFYMRQIGERILVYIVSILLFLTRFLNLQEIQTYFLSKCIMKIMHELYVLYLDTYNL